MNKIKISTPYRAELLVKPDIHVNDSGNIVIKGIPCVTYEMCDKELSLSAFSEHGELNCEGQMIDWEITLDDKPLEEGMDYFVFYKDKMELVRTVLDHESTWTGLMFWTVADALKWLKKPEMIGKIVKVFDYEFNNAPHYLVQV